MNAVSMSAPAAAFGNPVQHSQQVFRALLDAMANPGRRVDTGGDVGHPHGLAPSLAAALLTLCDFETPVLIGQGFDVQAIGDWLRFHTGAPAVAEHGRAAIALLDASHLPPLDDFALGSDEAPERGATLLIQVPSLDGPAALRWSGPGIKSETAMPLFGLPERFWRQRLLLGSAFPRGLDIYLGHDQALVGLPRSTTISFPEV